MIIYAAVGGRVYCMQKVNAGLTPQSFLGGAQVSLSLFLLICISVFLPVESTVSLRKGFTFFHLFWKKMFFKGAVS